MRKVYCDGSGANEFETRPYEGSETGLLAKCPRCQRVLKPTRQGTLRQHQVRGVTTRSMDRTMESLWENSKEVTNGRTRRHARHSRNNS